jgi:hypothetical protein
VTGHPIASAEFDPGGHFAAMAQPELHVGGRGADLRLSHEQTQMLTLWNGGLSWLESPG